MTPCTWERCTRGGPHEHKDKQGAVWATLCAEHDSQLQVALVSGEPKKILSAWVKAQGGSRAAAGRMQPAIDAGARLMATLFDR